MKKLKMTGTKTMTFEEGCNKYLDYCRQRNLREGTIRHYRQSYDYFYKYFDKNMLVEDIDVNAYKDYVSRVNFLLISIAAVSKLMGSVVYHIV